MELFTRSITFQVFYTQQSGRAEHLAEFRQNELPPILSSAPPPHHYLQRWTDPDSPEEGENRPKDHDYHDNQHVLPVTDLLGAGHYLRCRLKTETLCVLAGCELHDTS